MKWSVDKINTVWFGLTIGTLVGLALLSFINLFQIQQTTQKVRQARQTLLQIEIVIFLLKDTETGQRGYLLVGQEQYLKPYQTDSQTVEQELKALIQYANFYVTKPVDLEEFIGIVKLIESFWLAAVKLPPYGHLRL